MRIPFSNLGAGQTNCYMLHDAGEWLVVDLGASGARGRRALAAAFAEAGVDFSACRVFLTHGHFDHAGLLAEAVSARVEAFLSEAAFDLRQPALRAAVHDRFLRRMLAAGASEDDARGYAAANAGPSRSSRGRGRGASCVRETSCRWALFVFRGGNRRPHARPSGAVRASLRRALRRRPCAHGRGAFRGRLSRLGGRLGAVLGEPAQGGRSAGARDAAGPWRADLREPGAARCRDRPAQGGALRGRARGGRASA